MGNCTPQVDTKASRKSTTVRLYYFDIYGRGDTIRMILTYSGTPFDDNRVTPEEWALMRTTGMAEFGALPVLDIDGHMLIESRSIARYLCRKYAFYPNTPGEIYWVESLCDLKDDAFNPLFAALFAQDRKAIHKIYKTDMPFWLEKIQGRLENNKYSNKFFVGIYPTLADFEIFCFIFNAFMRNEVKEKREKVLDDYAPKVKEWALRFMTLSPKLQSYVDYRQSRPF